VLSGTVAPDYFFNSPTKPDRFLGKPYQAKQLIDSVKSVLPLDSISTQLPSLI
jgi:hypothetical protein